MIKACIFDMDGVIINSEPIHDIIWRDFFTKYHVAITPNDYGKFRGRAPGKTIRDYMPHIQDEEKLEKLTEERLEAARKFYVSQSIPLIPGIIPFLQKLRKEHIVTAVATSTLRDVAKIVLGRMGVLQYMDVLVGGDDITHAKPNPEIFLLAAKKLGVSPQECVVFEDALSGVEAAQAAGMKVVAILTSHKKEEFSTVDFASENFTQIKSEELFGI